MASYAYLEQCLEIHAAIMAGEFTSKNMPVSGEGNSYSFRSYGAVAVHSGEIIHIGQKAPQRPAIRATDRIAKELTACSIIAERCPELQPKLPLFFAWGDNEDGARPYILTEDATKSSTLSVNSQDTSPETRAILADGFKDLGTFKEVFDTDTVSNTVSFDVDGVERLLDLTPEPYYEAIELVMAEHRGLFTQSMRMLNGLYLPL